MGMNSPLPLNINLFDHPRKRRTEMNHSDLNEKTDLNELQKARMFWIMDNLTYARDLAQAVVKLGKPVELDKFAHSIYSEIEAGGYTFLAREDDTDWNSISKTWNISLSLFVLPEQCGEFWRRADNLLVNMVFANGMLDETADRVFIPGAWQEAAETIFTRLQDHEKAEAAIAQETERQRLLKQLQIGKRI
jgi:hypothetical protein